MLAAEFRTPAVIPTTTTPAASAMVPTTNTTTVASPPTPSQQQQQQQRRQSSSSLPGAGKHMLVTGGAGFIGGHVVDRAMREGYSVTMVDNVHTGCEDNFRHHLGNPKFRFFCHDVRHPFPPDIVMSAVAPDPATCVGSRVRYACIFHLACPASPVHYQSDPIGTTMTCINGTYNALELATQHDCPVLIASTSEVYGDPLTSPQMESDWGNVNCCGVRSCYDEGKRCAESLCFDFHRRHGTRIRVARFFNTYGPRMCFDDGRVISNFLVQALRGADITVYGTGENTRSYQYIDDLIEGCWRFVFHPTETGPINLGNPEEYSVLDMAVKAVALVPGTPSKLVYLAPAQDDPKQRCPSIVKAEAVLGWRPGVPVDEGLSRTVAEFRERMERDEGPRKW